MLLPLLSALVAVAALDDERWAKSRKHKGAGAGNASYFLQLGEQKCGTSSLFNIVSKHPDVGLITRYKEPHFWTRVVRTEWRDDACALVVGDARVNLSSFDGAADELRANFELTRRAYLGNLWAAEEGAAHGLVRSGKARARRTHFGDFSATNLLCVCCPDLISRFVPGARVYAVLRNPVKRVISRAAEGSWNKLSGRDDRARVLDEQLGEQRLRGVPARLVRLGDADAEAEWVGLLSHGVRPSRPGRCAGGCCA